MGLVAGGATGAGTDVNIDVTSLRSHKGQVLVCLTRDPKTFPDCRRDPAAFKAKLSANRAVTAHFDNVPAGRYAAAVLHDENGNGKADRAMGMIPVEGFGFSRDAPVRMGPPKFGEAAFTVGGAPASQTLRMRYLM